MSFDPVHDTQAVYRILLDCMALPGKIGNLAILRDRIGLESPLDKGLLLLALTLLDGETSFCVPRDGFTSDEAVDRVEEQVALSMIEAYLARICTCRIDEPGRAAFLFLPRISTAPEEPAEPSVQNCDTQTAEGAARRIERATRAIESAFLGTFMEPHLGATILAEIRSFSSSPERHQDAEASEKGGRQSSSGGSWILEGPGVNGSSLLACSPDDAAYLQAILDGRSKACSEFPLGVDLVILDREGQIRCIPRTTTVKEY